MDQKTNPRYTRRAAIKTITWFAGTAALAALVPSAPARAQSKLVKSAMGYRDAPNAGKDCDDCLQFIPGKDEDSAGACKIVEGPISPHGYCQAFTPKPRKKAD